MMVFTGAGGERHRRSVVAGHGRVLMMHLLCCRPPRSSGDSVWMMNDLGNGICLGYGQLALGFGLSRYCYVSHGLD